MPHRNVSDTKQLYLHSSMARHNCLPQIAAWRYVCGSVVLFPADRVIFAQSCAFPSSELGSCPHFHGTDRLGQSFVLWVVVHCCLHHWLFLLFAGQHHVR
jgi:hypothetical protein